MSSLAKRLEDGTVLFDRYVANDAGFRTKSFSVLEETDIYQFLSGELMTVEIVRPPRKIHIVNNKTQTHGNEILIEAAASKKGWVRLSNIAAPSLEPPHVYWTCTPRNFGPTIHRIGHPVLLKVGKTLLSNVSDADMSNDKIVVSDVKANPVLWMDCKRSGFDKYIDISERIDRIFRHKEVDEFLESVTGFLAETQGQLDVILWRPILDGQLAAMALFGPDFGKKPGFENVQVAGQGNIVLVSEDGGDTFDLTFSERMWVSPDVSGMSESFEPILMVRALRGAARGFRYKGVDYQFEAAIVPYGAIRGKDSQQI